MFFADLSSDGRSFHNLGPRYERQFCPIAEGCLNVSDDILVFAKTQEEHDKILQAVLERADEKNLRFNGRKCEFDWR